MFLYENHKDYVKNRPTPTIIVKQVSKPSQTQLSDIKVKNMKWNLSGFGNILIVSLDIENLGPTNIKDVGIVCSTYAKSGTRVGVGIGVVYDKFKSQTTKRVKEYNMGFINSQSEKAYCEVVKFAQDYFER